MPLRSHHTPTPPTAPRWRIDRHGVLIDGHIARFRDPAHQTLPLPPFPAFLNQPTPKAPAPASFPVVVNFADQRRHHLITIPTAPGTTLYGTGEVAGPLERTGRRTTVWATDCFGYDDRTPSMYQAHPWVLGVRRDGSAYGVLVETTWRTHIDLRRGIHFRCEGHSPAVIVIDRPDPQSVITALAELTGHMPMPPRWALGYQQCRWSYEPESKVREIAEEFRDRRIPCDVIWLDIDYMNGFRCFTFDCDKFPNPSNLNEELHSKGFKAVYMIDPGIKADPDYRVYKEGREGDHFVKTARGDEYHGKVWPGNCAFPDFTREKTRHWWAGLYKDFLATGMDGVWNDMNEPAVFDGPGKTMPETNLHRPDPDLGGPDPHPNPHAPHARYHNIYGMQMVRASREGIEAARPGSRPFLLTRSNFLGGHRYAATWTGDNTSTWPHLRWSIPMALNLGLSGQPFVGPDIGGFAGNADGKLFARWMGIGALLPFARAHSVKDSKGHEPWSFGPECERVCRLALERRYRLLPYLYTLFWESSRTGLPIIRPVFFADPKDPALRTVDDSFLIGPDILVRADVYPDPCHRLNRPCGLVGADPCHRLNRLCGLVGAGQQSPPYPQPRSPKPKGVWRAFEPAPQTNEDLPDLLLRAGAIIPLGPILQHTSEAPLDPLTLVISLDAAGRASGHHYEDTGDGYGFQTGEYLLTEYTAERQGAGVAITIRRTEGHLPRPKRALHVELLEANQVHRAQGRDGEQLLVPY